MKVLVTGGVRSGKSVHAESLLADADSVTYIAPGPSPDIDTDPDWAERIAAHRARRPDHWTTLEQADLAASVSGAPGAVLVDCLGTWLTAQLDELAAWEAPRADFEPELNRRIEDAVAAVARATGPVVLVTNEVGMGVVAAHRSGRLFADWLGTVNARMAQACDEVHLVVAGRVLTL